MIFLTILAALQIHGSCREPGREVYHFAHGLRPGRWEIVTCEAETLRVEVGVTRTVAYATHGCGWPVGMRRTGD